MKVSSILLLLFFLIFNQGCSLWLNINPKEKHSNLSKIEQNLQNSKELNWGQIEERAQLIIDSLLTDFALSIWKKSIELSENQNQIEIANIQQAFKIETQTQVSQNLESIQLERLQSVLSFSLKDKEEMAKSHQSSRVLYNIIRMGNSAGFSQKNFSNEALLLLLNYIDIYASVITKKAFEYAKIEERKKVYSRHVRLASEDFFDLPKIRKRNAISYYTVKAYEQSLHYINLRRSESTPLNIIKLEIDENHFNEAQEFIKDKLFKIWKKSSEISPDNSPLISGVDIFDVINLNFPFENNVDGGITLFPYSSDPLILSKELLAKIEVTDHGWSMMGDLLHSDGMNSMEQQQGFKPLDVFASEQLNDSLSHLLTSYLQLRSKGQTHHQASQYISTHVDIFPETKINPESLKAQEIMTPWKEKAFDTPKEWKLAPFKSPYMIEDVQMRSDFDSLRGLAAADINQDGFPDLFVAHEGSDSKLYLNLAGRGFKDITQSAGLSRFKGITTAHFADFNNDGCPDLLLIRPFEGLSLLQNSCQTQFLDVTQKYGLRITDKVIEALWVDLDRNGLLDLILLTQNQQNLPFLSNLVFLQKDKNIFKESASALGLDFPMSSLAALALDANSDGLLDLYFVNDHQDNQLFIQHISGKFKNESIKYNLPATKRSRGVALGDVNNDQNLDLYVSNLRSFKASRFKKNTRQGKSISNNHLLFLTPHDGFKNQHDKWFPKFSRSFWGWNHFFFDSGNRGILDLIFLNGHRPDSLSSHDEENVLAFQNIELQIFDFLSPQKSGLTLKNNSRSALAVDFDQNGALDLVISGLHQPLIYKNNLTTNKSKWISIELIGSRSNRDALGARVKVITAQRTQLKLYGSEGSAFLGHHLTPLHFGLGDVESIKRIEVVWPLGEKQTLINIEANQRLQLTEPL